MRDVKVGFVEKVYSEESPTPKAGHLAIIRLDGAPCISPQIMISSFVHREAMLAFPVLSTRFHHARRTIFFLCNVGIDQLIARAISPIEAVRAA